ncbi:MAG: LacI family DNA-binding transcriptional regulator [Clostridia bacterium]|nr:LacI family DNA-binding transcriptional regulator [Clostridia bacterium]MBN2882018.1 LacI family DNA-binding transcriptional regulator [Clostridia bacterium]
MKRLDRKITLRDIATEAGLSTTAVSKVLNDKGSTSSETQERVKKIAERMGYRPNLVAKSLKDNCTKTIGLVVADSSHSFLGSVIKGAQEEAARFGYNIILANTNRNRETEKKAINLLLEKRIDGLLLASSMLIQKIDKPFLESLGIPYIFLVRRSEDKEDAFVGNDNIRGAFDMVEYLIKTGSKKIHFLNMDKSSTSSKDRLKGYIKAHENYHIPYDSRLVYNMRPEIEEGYTAMREILERGEKVETVFCGCDIIGIGAMEAILEKGLKIPEDIRICGYDDIEFAAYLRKPFTTMRQPKEIIGVKAIDLLLDRIQNVQEKPGVVMLKSELVVRQST